MATPKEHFSEEGASLSTPDKTSSATGLKKMGLFRWSKIKIPGMERSFATFNRSIMVGPNQIGLRGLLVISFSTAACVKKTIQQSLVNVNRKENGYRTGAAVIVAEGDSQFSTIYSQYHTSLFTTSGIAGTEYNMILCFFLDSFYFM